MKKIRKLVLALLLTLALVASAEFAAARVVDRIVAVVNNEVITLSDLDRAFEPFRERMLSAKPGGGVSPLMLEQARREFLTRMIDDRLIEQEARRSGITVREADVTAAIQENLVRRGVTMETLLKELEKEGVTLEEFRRGIGDQLTRVRLIRREVRSFVLVTPEEIGLFYEKHRHEFEGEPQVRIQQILIAIPRKADAGLISRIEKEAQRIRERILRGESFEGFAAKYSFGAAAAHGGDLGFVGRGMMHPVIEEVAFKLPPHEISPVIASPAGFHIIRIIDRRGAGFVDLENIREEIRARIEEQKLEKRFGDWLSRLRKNSHIDVRM